MPTSESERIEKREGWLFAKHILRKIFLEDWLTKLVALAITLALWVGVTGLSTPTSRRIAEVPLTLSYSNNTEITNSPIQAVSIVISGDRRKVNQIIESGLVASVDLSDLAPGDRVVQLTPENVAIDLPLGVKLQEIQPNRIPIRLEAVEEKEVAVKVETQGEPPDGFEVYSESANPARVRIRGPVSYVRTLTSVPTEKIDLANRETDFTARQISLALANPKASAPDGVVDVAFRVGETRIEKTFSVPVTGTAGKRAQVTLFGARSLFDGVASNDLAVSTADGNEKPAVTLPASLDGRVEVRKVRLN